MGLEDEVRRIIAEERNAVSRIKEENERKREEFEEKRAIIKDEIRRRTKYQIYPGTGKPYTEENIEFTVQWYVSDYVAEKYRLTRLLPMKGFLGYATDRINAQFEKQSDIQKSLDNYLPVDEDKLRKLEEEIREVKLDLHFVRFNFIKRDRLKARLAVLEKRYTSLIIMSIENSVY